MDLKRLIRQTLTETLGVADAGVEAKRIPDANPNDPMDTKEDRLRRFNESIYLYYVQSSYNGNFKHTTKEDFYAQLQIKLDHIKTVEFDRRPLRGVQLKRRANPIHRMADYRDVWLSKNNRTLGEVWKEDWMESYWINASSH